jgi:hypothetical protein
MCSAIVQKVTGQRLIEYLGPRLFGPLGIETMSWEVLPPWNQHGRMGIKGANGSAGEVWPTVPAKRNVEWTADFEPGLGGGSHQLQNTAALADLEKARRESDWHQGYCYQFWRSRHNAYRGDGAFGQYTVVMPEQDAVVVITSESSNMQGQMNQIWDHLLPAMSTRSQSKNRKSLREMKERLASLGLAPVKGQGTSTLKNGISSRVYKVDPNDQGIETLQWEIGGDKVRFTLRDGRGLHNIDCGLGRWKDGEASMPGMPPKLTRGDLGPVSRVAASANWQDSETLEMRWQFFETPHHASVTCRFADSGETVGVELRDSLAKMGSKQPRWKLKATSQSGKT